MSRSSPSRQSSFSYTHTPSRRSSIASNPDVFSDDYALEHIDSRLDLNLHDTVISDHTLEDEQRRDTLNITPYPAIPARLSVPNRATSTSKRPVAQDESSAVNDESIQRTMSTSSRFSFVRSQSPYSGPTQPSHPYAMYPQITRASSIASASTVRPPENPFIPVGGPEHPYSMYHQNTVPEDDDDEDIGTQPIPLGFPRLGLGSQGPSGTRGSDVGDIVGTDGHIEQLPPYTRYADNVVAKGDMASINETSSVRASRRLSQMSTAVASEGPSQQLEFREADEREILLNEEKLKESWRDKARKKVCGGIALWLLVTIVAMVVVAGVIGGVIGGVVGRNQADAALAATTTDLDADPASPDKHTPSCPTGRYTIPFRQTSEINSCVANGVLAKTWSCLDIANLGITISEYVNASGYKTPTVRFDDYSVDTSTFLYGPQPPDFNGSSFDLMPYWDKDNKQYGVGMFFWKQFDKLSILPGKAIWPSKRHVDEREVMARGYDWDGQPLQIGDQPWFCFWNSTINEFWIYLSQPARPTSTWSAFSMVTSAPDPSSTVQLPPPPSDSSSTSSSSTPWNGLPNFPMPTNVNKRGIYRRGTYNSGPYYPEYPKLVRMVEKRLPEGNIQPYCQKMQIMPDWSVVPMAQVAVIPIIESEYYSDPINKRSETQDLKSNCVCEWMSA